MYASSLYLQFIVYLYLYELHTYMCFVFLFFRSKSREIRRVYIFSTENINLYRYLYIFFPPMLLFYTKKKIKLSSRGQLFAIRERYLIGITAMRIIYD